MECLFRDCRDGKSVFAAMKLDNKFDIDDMLNYSKVTDFTHTVSNHMKQSQVI